MRANLETKVRKCYETAPFPDNLRKAKNFDKELKRTIDWIKLNLNFLSQDLIKSNPKTILCAGCGTGEEAISLAKIFKSSKIDAIDISSDSLKVANENIRKAKVKNIATYKTSIITDLPKLNKKYDFIYCAGVIHHLSSPEKGFEILSKKLKNDSKMVIMLYNSYGLFLYNSQLLFLKLFAKNDIKKRILLVNLFAWGKGKSKAGLYDTYINPQVKTFSIGQVISWTRKRKLKIIGIVPPLNLQQQIEYATGGKEYFFRRKGLASLALKLSKIFKTKKYKSKKKENFSLPLYKIIFFQLIYLVLGKGECQYLITNS
jgi:ubiquinone/menaquinone biosynthesis C-methylase UbiE